MACLKAPDTVPDEEETRKPEHQYDREFLPQKHAPLGDQVEQPGNSR